MDESSGADGMAHAAARSVADAAVAVRALAEEYGRARLGSHEAWAYRYADELDELADKVARLEV